MVSVLKFFLAISSIFEIVTACFALFSEIPMPNLFVFASYSHSTGAPPHTFALLLSLAVVSTVFTERACVVLVIAYSNF